MPTDTVVRGSIDKLAANLGKAGVKIERHSPLLPDFADFDAALHADADVVPRRVVPAGGLCRRAGGRRRRSRRATPASAPERLRGMALVHRDWLMADGARTRLRAQWRELFKTV